MAKQRKHLRKSKKGKTFKAGRGCVTYINLTPHLRDLRRIAVSNAPPGTRVVTSANTKTGVISADLYDKKNKKIGQMGFKVVKGGLIPIKK